MNKDEYFRRIECGLPAGFDWPRQESPRPTPAPTAHACPTVYPCPGCAAALDRTLGPCSCRSLSEGLCGRCEAEAAAYQHHQEATR